VIPQQPADPVAPQELITRLRRHAHPLSPIPTGRHTQPASLPGIRAVLFDVYGTLFISASGDIAGGSAEVRRRAMAETLEAVEIPVSRNTAQRAAGVLEDSITRAHNRLKAQGVQYPEVDIRSIVLQMLEQLQGRRNDGRPPDRELCETLAVEYECRSNPTWPMPGLVQTLRELGKREMSLGIVSNAQFFTPLLFPAHLGATVEELGFDLELCMWSYLLLEAKPSPNLFRRVLQTLKHRGIEAQCVLYVGNDRVNDIWPAAGSGMRTALFAGDSRSFRPRQADPRIRGVHEDVLLTDLRQLPELLGSG
jgi:putative hydrolase of the HAD superfamily